MVRRYNREEELLERCYQSIYDIVETEGFRSVAFPAMGIGSYRWPVERATPIAVRAAQEFHRQHPEILLRFMCFTGDITAHYLEKKVLRSENFTVI